MNVNYLLVIVLLTITSSVLFESAYAEENVQVEIKYTNGDRADFYGMKLLVYQDFDKEVFMEKQLESNPQILTLPENHRYKIEVYANEMYADVGYVQLDNSPKDILINIPLSGGLKVKVFYEDGETPIEGARVVLKSSNNIELRQGITNQFGETLRYWIQSTVIPNNNYSVDVYLGEIFLKSEKSIQVQPGLSTDEKIIVGVPLQKSNLIKTIHGQKRKFR
jgi:hypothetical protein